VNYLEEIDYQKPEFGDLYDELPLWSAPFGLMLLEQVTDGSSLLRHYFIRLGFVQGLEVRRAGRGR